MKQFMSNEASEKTCGKMKRVNSLRKIISAVLAMTFILSMAFPIMAAQANRGAMYPLDEALALEAFEVFEEEVFDFDVEAYNTRLDAYGQQLATFHEMAYESGNFELADEIQSEVNRLYEIYLTLLILPENAAYIPRYCVFAFRAEHFYALENEYLYLIHHYNIIFFGDSPYNDFSPAIMPFNTQTHPQVTTNPATNITSTSAILRGSTRVPYPTHGRMWFYGFEYSTNANMSNARTLFWSSSPFSGGLDQPISGLLPNTQYFFRAFVFSNPGGQTGQRIHGNVQNFRTSPGATPVWSLRPQQTMTFAAANVGYGPQPLTGVVEIDNTGSVPLTGVSASITSGVHAFEIPQQPAATVPNTGASAGWLIVRPRTGLPVGTHNGVLTVTSSNGGSRNVNLSFTVNAGTNLTVNQTSWNPSASWSSTTVSVTSNTSWTVSSSATSWLTVSPSHGSNNGSFTIMAQSNPNATQRSATVTVRTADWAIARNITVTQAALMLAPPPPARSISLTNGPMIFAALPVGYAQPAAQSTVITNNGGQATQQLTVTAPTGFRVSTSQNGTFSTSVAIASIPVGGRAEFWTRPITGLTVAEHRGDVTVRNTTTQTPALTERTRAVSFRVNPAPRVPFAIFDLEAIPGDRRVTLNWTAPNDGGSPITHYEFRQRIGNNEWGNWTSTGLALPTLTRINLTNGVSHSFQVRAVNNVPGDAIGSNTATATPAATVLMVPEELALPSTEHTTTINVTSNTTWTVSVSNDARLWLTVSDITPANRTGNGSFRITVRPNPGPARSGTITVTGGGITRNIRVTQAPRRLTLSARILHDDSALQHHSTAEMQAIFNDATAIFLDIFNVEFHLGNNISRSAELNPVLRSCTLDTICIFGSCENAPECGLNCHTDHCKSAPRMARVQPHSFMYTLRIVGYLTCVYDTSICRITGLTVGHRAVGGLARYLGSRDTIVSNQYIAVATDGFTIEHLIQHELAHSLGARDFYCTVQYCVMKRGTTGRENHLCDNCKADIWNHLAQIYNHSTGFAYEYALIYEHNLTDYSDNAWNNTTYLGGELNEKRKKYIDSDI